MATEQDREHWSEVSQDYSAGWQSPARQAMSSRELDFVLRHAVRSPATRMLDVGVGTGRILDGLLSVAPPDCEVYGLDVSQEMLDLTKRRFDGDARVKSLRSCDVSSEEVPFDGDFDVITAVRILKYSANWPTVVRRLAARLTPHGVFVFSLSNARSLNRFSRPYAVATHHADVRQVSEICSTAGLDVLDLSGFTRLPYTLYTSARSGRSTAVLLTADRALDAVLGRVALTRELFVAVSSCLPLQRR